MLFEESSRAPERLLERRAGRHHPPPASPPPLTAPPPTAEGRRPSPDRHARGAEGASRADADADEGAPAASDGAAARPSTSDSHEERAAGAAGWLLLEGRRRQAHQKRIAEAEAELLRVLPKLEAAGDAVWFQGELYRQKMRGDVQAVLVRLELEAAARRAEAESASALVAPRRALAPTEAAAIDEAVVMRTAAAMPSATWARPAPGTPMRVVEPPLGRPFGASATPKRPVTAPGQQPARRSRPASRQK